MSGTNGIPGAAIVSPFYRGPASPCVPLPPKVPPAIKALIAALASKADLVDGKVPANELPSYVDDVIEVPNYVSLPAQGRSGTIYVTLDTGKYYRWSGTTYVWIGMGTQDVVTSVNGMTGDVTLAVVDPNIADATGQVADALATRLTFGNVRSSIGIPAFMTDTTYVPGRKVVHDGAIWNCVNEVFVAGPWTGTDNWVKLFDIATDVTPTADSTKLVTSGVVKSAFDAAGERITANANAITAINGKIPNVASTENQLADKAFVNSSIQTNTATFRGTYNLVRDLELTTTATQQQIATAIATKLASFDPPVVPDDNDYCFVQIPRATDDPADFDPTIVARVDRYKCTVTESGGVETRTWSYEWSLNNSSFTADQWAAINSGITDSLVTKLSGVEAGAEVNEIVDVKVGATSLIDANRVVTLGDAATKNVGVNANQVAAGDAVRVIDYALPDDCFPVKYSYNGEDYEITDSRELTFTLNSPYPDCIGMRSAIDDVLICLFRSIDGKYGGSGDVNPLTFGTAESSPEAPTWPVLRKNLPYVHDVLVAKDAEKLSTTGGKLTGPLDITGLTSEGTHGLRLIEGADLSARSSAEYGSEQISFFEYGTESAVYPFIGANRIAKLGDITEAVPAASDALPLLASTARSAGDVGTYSRGDHVHPAESQIKSRFSLPASCFPITYSDVTFEASARARKITSNDGIRFAINEHGYITLHDIVSEAEGGYSHGFCLFNATSLTFSGVDAPITNLKFNNVSPVSNTSPVLTKGPIADAVLVRGAEVTTKDYVDEQVGSAVPAFLPHSFTVESATFNNANHAGGIKFKPSYFGMVSGARLKSVTVRTRGSGATSIPTVYARLKRSSDGLVLGMSGVQSWPGTTDTDVTFTFPVSVVLSSNSAEYVIDFTTFNSVSDSATSVGLRVYDYSANPDCYFGDTNTVVPVLTVQYYSPIDSDMAPLATRVYTHTTVADATLGLLNRAVPYDIQQWSEPLAPNNYAYGYSTIYFKPQAFGMVNGSALFSFTVMSHQDLIRLPTDPVFAKIMDGTTVRAVSQPVLMTQPSTVYTFILDREYVFADVTKQYTIKFFQFSGDGTSQHNVALKLNTSASSPDLYYGPSNAYTWRPTMSTKWYYPTPAPVRYDLGVLTTISSASTDSSVTPSVTYGSVTMSDRKVNYVRVTTAIDQLRITFPAEVPGKVRDFELRVEVGTGSAALTAPSVVKVDPTGETIALVNSSGTMPVLEDGTASARGVTMLYFSETVGHEFLVKGEPLVTIA